MQLLLHHKFYGEVLPYLNVTKNIEEEIKPQVEVPNVVGKPLKDAKLVLEELGLECEINGENQEEIVKDQLPKEGIKVNIGSKIFLYN